MTSCAVCGEWIRTRPDGIDSEPVSSVESCDFLSLLKEQGHLPLDPVPAGPHGTEFATTEGTTILAIRYREGVLIAGDRRATMGNTVVYDRADKVLSIDDDAVMALAGSPAIAYEMARLLEISFQHYRRSQLQVLSLDGKLRILSRLLRDNLSLALQGIGAVIPIFAAFDADESQGKIFFYDVLGAQFESVDFCTTGSGSPIIPRRPLPSQPLARASGGDGRSRVSGTGIEDAGNRRGVRHGHRRD